MDHANPLPDGPPMASREPARDVQPAGIKTPSVCSGTSSPRLRETPQTRLLQLRNAGFRGSVIAGRRVSPVFSSPCSQPPDSSGCSISDDHASKNAEIRTLYGEDLPPSPGNILQEIHNSTRRKRLSPKLGFGEIFQDSVTDENSLESPLAISHYNPGHRDGSLAPSKVTNPKMSRLRESQWAAKGPSPRSPPAAKQGKGRKISRAHKRSTSFEAASYIEHLESQLAAANAKIDSMMSPTTNKARAARLRALSNESRSLRQEVSTWEARFEERVQEQLDRRTEVENGMQAHIQYLEEELEVKDARTKELEWELDNLTSKIRDVEGLEEINLNLERRIDVLTNLVAQSPTKLDLCSTASSPTKANPSSRAHRRRSMLPRMPSSPGGVRLSLNTANDGGFWSSRRFGSNSSTLASPEGTHGMIEEEEEADKSLEHPARDLLSGSLSATSASTTSLPFSFTRPTSIHSASSLDLSSPELQFPLEMDSQIKSVNRQRRMRRFPSGACTLKPLLLPRATASASFPALTSTSAAVSPSRHTSNLSLDPTVAFLSKIDDGSPISTPTQGLRQRSATWAQEETLKTLERNSKALNFLDDGAPARSPRSPVDVSLNSNGALVEEIPRPTRSRPLSLDKELEIANMLSPNNFDDALTPVEAEDDDKLQSISIGIEQLPNTPPIENDLRPPKSPSEIDVTPRPRLNETLVPSPPQSIPRPILRKGSALGIFTRLTNLINRVKQDPVVLAQRLLCNAWTMGSARFGGAGWWLLGLLFRSDRRGKTSRADRKTVEDYTASNFNCNHLSITASRRRIAEHHAGDDRGMVSERENRPGRTGLTPPLEASPLDGPQVTLVSPSPLTRGGSHRSLCDACIEPSSRRTFRLWFHFSLAMVLAVGMAIKHGPGTLLMDPHIHSEPAHEVPEPEKSESSRRSNSVITDGFAPRESATARAKTEDENQDNDRGYHIAFAPIIGPEHFNGV